MRKGIIYLLLVLVACNEPVSPPEFEAVYEQAQQAYTQKYYGQMLELADQAIVVAPSAVDSAQVYYLKYLANYSLQDYTAAGTELQLAIHYSTGHPQKAKFHAALTYFYYTLGAYQESHNAGQKMMGYITDEIDPSQLNNYYYFNALQVAVQVDDYTAVTSILKKIETQYLTQNNLANYHASQILTLYHHNKFVEAIEYGTLVLSQGNAYQGEGLTWIHNHLALSYTALDKHDQALKHFHKALRYYPQNPRILLNIAQSYLAIGETQQVLTHTQSVTDMLFSQVEPRYYDQVRRAYRMQYQALLQLERTAEAQSLQNQAHQFDLQATKASAEAISSLAFQIVTIEQTKKYTLDLSRQHAQLLSVERHKSHLTLLTSIGLGTLLLVTLYLLWRVRHYQHRTQRDETFFTDVHHAVAELEESLKNL